MIHIFHTHVHIYMLTHLKFETHTMNISGGRITSTYALPPPRFPGIISQNISKVSSTVPYSCSIQSITVAPYSTVNRKYLKSQLHSSSIHSITVNQAASRCLRFFTSFFSIAANFRQDFAKVGSLLNYIW